jgi:hypothetical protein
MPEVPAKRLEGTKTWIDAAQISISGMYTIVFDGESCNVMRNKTVIRELRGRNTVIVQGPCTCYVLKGYISLTNLCK